MSNLNSFQPTVLIYILCLKGIVIMIVIAKVIWNVEVLKMEKAIVWKYFLISIFQLMPSAVMILAGWMNKWNK